MCYQSCDKPFLLFFSPFSFSPYVAICPAGCPTNSQCTAPGQCTSVCMIKKNCKQIKLFMKHECIFFLAVVCLDGVGTPVISVYQLQGVVSPFAV